MMTIDPKAVVDLAPCGVLRVALNLANPNLVQQSPTGSFSGLAVDLATELAARLELPLEWISFAGAGSIVAAAANGGWDIAFLAADPLRASELLFTNAYVTLSGSFVVRDASHFKVNADVDQTGVHIVVGKGSAYDLYLSKTIERARLVRVPTTSDVLPAMIREGYEVAAGVRQQLEEQVLGTSGLRVLDGRFMTIFQTAAVPSSHRLGSVLLQDFIAEVTASGLVQRSLLLHGVKGADVATST